MPLNSRAKGKRGELLAAQLLREHGFADARRGRQFSGSQDSPDVIGLDGWFVEVKHRQAGSVYSWMSQATADCGLSRPLVLHRRNRGAWLATVRAEDFLQLLRLVIDSPKVDLNKDAAHYRVKNGRIVGRVVNGHVVPIARRRKQ